jgi:cyclopropane fatty-acyl-phospholipid synthase-like methyltransferase
MQFFRKRKKTIKISKVKKYFLYDTDTYKVVFIDGVYNPFLSDTTHDGLDVSKDLSDAQNNKYQKLIDLIKPNNGDKVLEIGCGWGGFAEYLGKKYDVKLDCITISNTKLPLFGLIRSINF